MGRIYDEATKESRKPAGTPYLCETTRIQRSESQCWPRHFVIEFTMGKKSQKLPTLDLHGKKTDAVFDLVDQFIMKHQNRDRICIIPGKGSGAIKKELLKYLKLGGYPWEYEILSNGAKNTGSLVIHTG